MKGAPDAGFADLADPVANFVDSVAAAVRPLPGRFARLALPIGRCSSHRSHQGGR